MKNLRLLLAFGLLLVLGACQKSVKLSEAGLIPLPQEITDGAGTFELSQEIETRLASSLKSTERISFEEVKQRLKLR